MFAWRALHPVNDQSTHPVFDANVASLWLVLLCGGWCLNQLLHETPDHMHNFSVFFPLALCIFGILIYSLTVKKCRLYCIVCVRVSTWSGFPAVSSVTLQRLNPESVGELREQVCTATDQVEYQQRHLPPL